jgi:hypothetical protein
LLAEMKKNEQMARGTRGQGNPNWLGGTHEVPPNEKLPTLEQMGISKNQSTAWQSIPEKPGFNGYSLSHYPKTMADFAITTFLRLNFKSKT